MDLDDTLIALADDTRRRILERLAGSPDKERVMPYPDPVPTVKPGYWMGRTC